MRGNKINYDTENKQYILKLKKELKDELTKNRYEHTIGVAYTAASMAMCFGTNVDEALIAGLLHDCAKCIDDEEKIRLCEKYGIVVSEYEKTHPYLLHAKLGAVLPEKKNYQKNPDILNAIRFHTTGTEDMTMLEKIIYIADYIEPGRKEIPALSLVRKTAFMDLNLCMYQILQACITYLESTMGNDIDENTRIAYRYYQSLIENGGKHE